MAVSIKEKTNKIKGYLKDKLMGDVRPFLSRNLGNDHIFSTILIILVGVSSFGLGRISVSENSTLGSDSQQVSNKEVIFYENRDDPGLGAAAITSADYSESESLKNYVGSVNSTKYHLPWCGGAQRIAEENKIWFASKEEAEMAGYTPAGNCKGL